MKCPTCGKPGGIVLAFSVAECLVCRPDSTVEEGSSVRGDGGVSPPPGCSGADLGQWLSDHPFVPVLVKNAYQDYWILMSCRRGFVHYRQTDSNWVEVEVSKVGPSIVFDELLPPADVSLPPTFSVTSDPVGLEEGSLANWMEANLNAPILCSYRNTIRITCKCPQKDKYSETNPVFGHWQPYVWDNLRGRLQGLRAIRLLTPEEAKVIEEYHKVLLL